MVGPIRVEGLFSGIDFSSIIEKLVAVERQPIEALQKHIQDDTARKTAYLDLSARLLSIQTSANALSLPSFFSRTKVVSSEESSLFASGSQVASVGAFTFQVRRLATSHQLLSNGFADRDTTRIGPGALTVEFGDGAIERRTPLARLNGGRGVDPGFVRVTDNAGGSARVDLEGAVTLRDVADALNGATGVKVFADVEADRLVLYDRTGLAGTGLRVDDVGQDTTATDLGLAGKTAVNLGGAPPDVRLFGGTVNALTSTTALSTLNDGLGVRSIAGSDFTIQPKSGAAFAVDIPSTARTVQDVLDAINGNAANAGRIAASINAEGTGIRLLDVSGGAGALGVAAVGSSAALQDLGLAGVSVLDDATGQASVAGTVLSGRRLLSSFDGVLVHSLNGGTPAAAASDAFAGVRDGTLRLQNKAGAAAVDVNLSRRTSFAYDSTIAAALPTVRVATPAGTPVSFAVGNRITLTGTVGGIGTTVVRTVAGVVAGPPGFTDVSFDEALPAGFTLAAGNAVTTVVEGTADALRLINAAGASAGITARVSDEGNGLLLVDASSGGGSLTIENVRTQLSAAAPAGSASITVADAAGYQVGQTIRLTAAGASEFRTITGIAGNVLGLDSVIATAGGFAAGDEVSGVAATDFGLINGGRAETGTATSFTDGALAGLPDDFLVGATVRILGGPNAGTVRTVSDFDGATGTVTLSGAALGSAFDATTVYGLSFDPSRARGRDLDPRYIGESTLLSTLNGGAGVAKGRLQITDRASRQIVVDLRQSDDTTIGKVLIDINNAALAAGSTLTARINDTGDGILLFDSAAFGNAVRVDELDNGRTARDLNLAGVAPSTAPQTIDGSFEYRIDLATPSTLDDIVQAVNARGIPVTASILNDGSGTSPYRLSLLSTRSGGAGRMVVDAGRGLNSALRFSTTTRGEDAELLFGTDSGANDPAKIVSSGNTISDVVPGLTLDLRAVSSGAVTVSVSRDTDGVVDQVKRLADTYNDAQSKIAELTKFEPDTQTRGILFGDAAVQNVQQALADAFVEPVTGLAAGRLNALSQVGFGFDPAGQLILDESTFRGLLSSRFDEVRDLFTAQAKMGLGTLLSDLNGGRGVNRVSGSDLRIFQRDGTAVTVDLLSATKVGDILNAININADNTGDLAASVSADGFHFVLTDNAAAQTFSAAAGTSGNKLVAAAGGPFDGKPDGFYTGLTLRRSDTGDTAVVTGFVGATRTFTLSKSIFAGGGDPWAVDLQAVNVNGSLAAGDLGLGKVAGVGSAVLTGDLRNLTNDPGAAPRLSRRLDFLTRTPDGLLPIRTASLDEDVKHFNEDIDAVDARALRLEIRLVKQFSQLEQLIALSQGTINRLQASFASLLGTASSAKK